MVETEEGKILRDEMEIEPCQADVPRLTHSLHGKQQWPPVLRSVRTGGSGPRKRRSLKKKKKKEMRKMHTENNVEHNAKRRGDLQCGSAGTVAVAGNEKGREGGEGDDDVACGCQDGAEAADGVQQVGAPSEGIEHCEKEL